MQKRELTIRQAVGIGAMVGFLPVFYVLLVILIQSLENGMDDEFFLLFVAIVGLGVIFFGVIGALTGYALRKNKIVIIVSAIIGTIIGSFGGFFTLILFFGPA